MSIWKCIVVSIKNLCYYRTHRVTKCKIPHSGSIEQTRRYVTEMFLNAYGLTLVEFPDAEVPRCVLLSTAQKEIIRKVKLEASRRNIQYYIGLR